MKRFTQFGVLKFHNKLTQLEVESTVRKLLSEVQFFIRVNLVE